MSESNSSYGNSIKFVLGAMQANYDIDSLTAKDIAMKGLNAGAEFDIYTGAPLDVYSFDIEVEDL